MRVDIEHQQLPTRCSVRGRIASLHPRADSLTTFFADPSTRPRVERRWLPIWARPQSTPRRVTARYQTGRILPHRPRSSRPSGRVASHRVNSRELCASADRTPALYGYAGFLSRLCPAQLHLLLPSSTIRVAAVLNHRSYCLLLAAALLGNTSVASGQESGISAGHPDVGIVETKIQKYDHALGVTSSMRRSPDKDVECNGMCYFPSGGRGINWVCGPGKICNLYCTRNPPVGGCN